MIRTTRILFGAPGCFTDRHQWFPLAGVALCLVLAGVAEVLL